MVRLVWNGNSDYYSGGHSTEAVRHGVVATGRMDCIVQFELLEKLGSDFWWLVFRVLLGLTMR